MTSSDKMTHDDILKLGCKKLIKRLGVISRVSQVGYLCGNDYGSFGVFICHDCVKKYKKAEEQTAQKIIQFIDNEPPFVCLKCNEQWNGVCSRKNLIYQINATFLTSHSPQLLDTENREGDDQPSLDKKLAHNPADTSKSKPSEKQSLSSEGEDLQYMINVVKKEMVTSKDIDKKVRREKKETS